MQPLPDKVIEKFWASVEKTDTCWIWIGAHNTKSGSPILRHGQETFSAKKVSILLHGKTTSNRVVSLCRVSNCVNPYHLASGDEDRFWSRVIKMTDGCWIWTGPLSTTKYGTLRIRSQNRRVSAHHYSWELYTGRPVPKGIFLCHYCDVPLCVNPHHLWMGTIQDNNKDRDNKGRQARGETHGKNKLTEEQVKEIRASWPVLSQRKLATKYNVARQVIQNILKRKIWKHVE